MEGKRGCLLLNLSLATPLATGRASSLQKAGCWFVGGDDSTAALHVLVLQLSLSLSSAPIKPANPGSPGKMAVKTERYIYCSGVTMSSFLRMLYIKKTEIFRK